MEPNGDHIFEHNPETFQFLRRQYGLDNPERLDEAIKILQDWLNKQEHIIKKDYSKDYLERAIIRNKGSLEKVKNKFDKIATYRTFLPSFFEPIPDVTKIQFLDQIIVALTPKITEDHYRVIVLKNMANQFNSSNNFYLFRYFVMLSEYFQCNDFCNGVIAVLDYRESNTYELVKTLDTTFQQFTKILMDGFGTRVKNVHVLSTSKSIDLLVTFFKQVLSAKVGERLIVHKTVEELHGYVPRDILPKDYGGQAKTISALSYDLKTALRSEGSMKHFKEMQNACTNEEKRVGGKLNDQYLGIQGSFRTLNVD